MRCETCGEKSSYIKVLSNGEERCSNCGGFSEAGGIDTTGLLTRNSQRVREDSAKHECDFIQPHKFDKNTRKIGVNPDFVKEYPDKVKDYFSEEEVEKAGYPKLSKAIKKQKIADKKHREAQ